VAVSRTRCSYLPSTGLLCDPSMSSMKQRPSAAPSSVALEVGAATGALRFPSHDIPHAGGASSGASRYGATAAAAADGSAFVGEDPNFSDIKIRTKLDFLGTGDSDMSALFIRKAEGDQANWGTLYSWANLGVAALYLIAAFALMFVVIFVANGSIGTFWDPLLWDSIDSKWEVSLLSAGGIHVDWALVAMLAIFGLYHAAYFIPFVQTFYFNTLSYEYNPIRWAFWGTAGALVLGFYALIMGVSNIIIFVAMVLTVTAGCAFLLCMEMINRPVLVQVAADAPKRTSGKNVPFVGQFFDTELKAVNPLAFVFAIIALAFYIGITWTYFWNCVHDHIHGVPWYAWFIGVLTALALIAVALLNGIRYVVSWKFLKFFYLDVLHTVVEVILVLGGTLVFIIGVSV